MSSEPEPPPAVVVELVERTRGRRTFDLPPNMTKVLIAWAVTGPAVVAALVALRLG